MALTRITKGVIKPNENYDTHNINSTGIVTATALNISGNATIGGVLTYEDVTNIDSVGIITAKSGIHVTNGNVGIETTFPGESLDIVSATNSKTIRIWSKGTSSSSRLILRTGDSGNSRIFFGDNSDTDVGEIRYIHATDTMRFFVGGDTTSKFDITSNGKVGVGVDPTNYPGIFVVSGDALICDRDIHSRVANSVANSDRGFKQDIDGTEKLHLYADNSSNIILEGNGGSEKVRITSGGDVKVATAVTITSAGAGFYAGIVTASDFVKRDGSGLGAASHEYYLRHYDTSGNTSSNGVNMFGGYRAGGLGGGNTNSLTTGEYNHAVGWEAGQEINSGNSNTFFGYKSGTDVRTGSGNVAMGSETLMTARSNNGNTAIGHNALRTLNENQSLNVAVGYYALREATTAERNVAVGQGSGAGSLTGDRNTFLGNQAGGTGTNNITSGSNNILLGNEAQATSATVSNEVTIGNSSVNHVRIPGLSVSINQTESILPAANFSPGVLQETYHNDTGGGMVGNYNHHVLTYGMVWYGVTNAVGAWTFNIRGNSTTTFDSITTTNRVTTMTIYSANNNAANYMSAFNIDGVTQTVKWAGGSAPSVATGSGVDVYSMTIMKTGAGAYHVFGNFTNFA